MRGAKWLKGYVLVRVSGRGCGRFFNLCVKNGIGLWQVRQVGEDQFVFFGLRKDIRSMHPYIRKCRVHIRILEKHGLWFLLFRYRHRIVFPIALALVVLLFGYASRFVWKIEVYGNSSVTAETLTDYLREKNSGLGAVVSDIDCDALELSIRRDFARVIWASVSIEGTDMIVELQEKVALPGEADDGATQSASSGRSGSGQQGAARDAAGGLETDIGQQGAEHDEAVGKSTDIGEQDAAQSASGEHDAGSRNLVAAEDGRVLSIITRRGTPLVKAGDQVKKGQVLIRGSQDILDDSGQVMAQLAARADGDISGRVQLAYKDRISFYRVEKVREDSRISELSFDFFGNHISLPLWGDGYEKSETVREYHQLHLTDQFYLPVTLAVNRRYEIRERKKEYSPKEALEEAQKHLDKYVQRLKEEGASVTDRRVVMKKDSKGYLVQGKLTVECEIGTMD